MPLRAAAPVILHNSGSWRRRKALSCGNGCRSLARPPRFQRLGDAFSLISHAISRKKAEAPDRIRRS